LSACGLSDLMYKYIDDPLDHATYQLVNSIMAET